VVETDPERMLAAMIGIPGVTVIEARTTADTLDVLVETELRPPRCPRCGGAVKRAGAELEDLAPSSAVGRVSRLTWRRRRWHCPAEDCPIDVFSEDDAGVDAFNERVAAATTRFLLEAVSSPPSDWRDRLEE
jgi:transposase